SAERGSDGQVRRRWPSRVSQATARVRTATRPLGPTLGAPGSARQLGADANRGDDVSRSEWPSRQAGPRAARPPLQAPEEPRPSRPATWGEATRSGVIPEHWPSRAYGPCKPQLTGLRMVERVVVAALMLGTSSSRSRGRYVADASARGVPSRCAPGSRTTVLLRPLS